MVAMTDPVIRPARPEEVDRVVELWAALVKDQNRYTRSVRATRDNRAAMREHLAALVPHGQVLVVEHQGRLVGFAAIVVNLPKLDLFYASAAISDVYVEPEVRGRGWGRALLEAAIAVVRDAGLHAVTITVAAGNEGAKALYRKAGFRPDKETLLLPLDTDFVKFGPDAPEE